MSPAKKKSKGVESYQDRSGRMHFRPPPPAKKKGQIIAHQDRSGRLRFRAASLSGEPNPLVVYQDRRGRRYFTRTSLKVWLLTWNCGNTYPSNEHLNTLIIDRLLSCPPAGWPHLIVIGAQEHKRQTPIHSRIPALMAGRAPDFRLLGECVVEGHSGGKWYKLDTGANCQALGVLVRNDIQDIKILTSINATRKRGKGGIGLGVDIKIGDNVLKLVFISAHLGSYDRPEDQRENDFLRILGEVGLKRRDLYTNSMEPVNAFADVIFLMGDLNFRLRQSEMGLGKLLTEMTNRGDIANFISQQAYSRLLEQDEIDNSSLVTGANGVAFEFPEPDFPPTYKIKAGHQDPAQSQDRALNTYFGRKKAAEPWEYLKPKSKKRSGIDIGWLDRIGWAKSWAGWGDPLTNNPAEVYVREYNALHEVIMSDHVPVLMKVEVVIYR